MKNMKLNKSMIIIIFSICIIISCLSGCTENDTQNENGTNDKNDFNDDQGQDNDKNNDNLTDEEDTDRFIGIWTGNLVLESEKGDTIITEFKFEENTVDVTMRYDLIEEDDESDDKWWNWRDKEDENKEEKSDSITITYNYEVQGDELVLESSSEKDGKTSTTVYFYSFNDDYDVLYIDGYAFTKN